MAALTRVDGVLRVPGDKSISHRALLLSALATGESRVTGLLTGADVRSTAGVLRAYGVDLPSVGTEMLVRGVGRRGFVPPSDPLECGNSGTTTRLVAGLAAAYPFESTFVGDASLSRRPMKRVAKPLEAMGAVVSFGGGKGEGLPMTVRGGDLRSIEWRSETASAQVKSAVLLAGLAAGVSVTVSEPELSRDHTERMLTAMGAALSRRGTTVTLAPVERLRPIDVAVPADPSSAAFFAALAVLATAGSLVLTDVCLNATRTGFFDTLRAMGATLRREDERIAGGEPVGTLVATPATLRGVEVRGAAIPTMIDELPLLACVAARAQGETRIRDAAELRGKESDRIRAVVANLQRLGVEADEFDDGLRVVGSDRPLVGTVETHGDHRLAMAFGMLGAVSGGGIVIDDRDCVSVSYPGFWDDLARVQQ
ncbi:MAG: 3-phosphoshikimate 1-carboxyvinyltransferase [Gemmatimonadaceae bacterium]|nr:3-phosphoshikimate 1-carboxyvinyltransferase [Gemmatimonadaceae bacterium]